MRISDWSSDVCSSDLQNYLHMSPQRVHPRTCLADVRRRTGNDRYPTASTFPPETALTKFMQNLFRDYVDGPRIVRMTIGEAQHSFRSEEHKSELKSLMRNSSPDFC